jgi:hypothetical protein
MAKVIKWISSFGERIINETEERDKREAKRPKGHRKYEYDSLASYKEYSSSGRRRLESLEGAMRFFFEHSGVRLGYMQKRLVDVVIIAMLTKIFGDDLVANLSYIHKKFKIDKLNDTFAIIFPRRSGKTEGSAIMIALILVSQPDGNCIMYNLTGTQAKEFLNSVMNYLKVWRSSTHTHTQTQTHAHSSNNFILPN